MKKNHKRKGKHSLGETQKGIIVTPERIVLYGLGVLAIGGTFWVAKKYIDSLTQKVNEKDKDQKDQKEIIIVQPGTTTPTTPTEPVKPTPQPCLTEPEVVIPPVTNDRYWGNVQNTIRDDFPLRKGMGGLRVKALQQAYRKLGYGITNATGYFGQVTEGITQRLLGKNTVSEEEFIRILKNAKMRTLEGVDVFVDTPKSYIARLLGLN